MKNLGKKTDEQSSAYTTVLKRKRGFSPLWALLCAPLLYGCMSIESISKDETARSEINYVKNEQDNIDVEIRILEGRIETLEETFSALRQEVTNQQSASLKQVSGQLADLDNRLLGLQSLADDLSGDIRELKNQSNTLEASFSQYKRRFGEVEGVIQRHERNIDNLEAAMRSLTALVKGAPASGTKVSGVTAANHTRVIYKVQTGDTLEKIAEAHGVTVRALRETNQVQGDLIISGQELIIPR